MLRSGTRALHRQVLAGPGLSFTAPAMVLHSRPPCVVTLNLLSPSSSFGRYAATALDPTTNELEKKDGGSSSSSERGPCGEGEEEKELLPGAKPAEDVQSQQRHSIDITGFTINGLNRFHAHHLRKDEAWLRHALHESPNSRFLAFHKLRPMVEHRTPPTHLGPILAWQERDEIRSLLSNANFLLLGQSLRGTNSDRSIQEQLSDESNQINMFAFDLDPLLGKDDNEAKLYTSAHEKLLEVRTSFEEPRTIVPHLPPWEGGIVAQVAPFLCPVA